MRKWFFLLLCVVCFIPVAASAHSGRTDGSGGHWNRSTGVYHYHHGYSAHDHYDMDGDGKKDCPYEFQNKTTTQNKISLPVPTYPEIQTPTYPKITAQTTSTEPTKDKSTVKKENVGVHGFLIFLVTFESFAVICLAYFMHEKNNEIDALREQHQRELEIQQKDFEKKTSSMIQGIQELSELESKIQTSHGNLNDIISQINSKKDALQFWESEKKKAKLEADRIRESALKEKEQYMLEIARMRNAPVDISFAKDGYPIWWDVSDKKPYGDFTVYYNEKAKVFHIDYACAPYFARETHLFKVCKEGRPCKKCARKFDGYRIPGWFTNQ